MTVTVQSKTFVTQNQPKGWNPNCPQRTLPSVESQPTSQTVPQALLMHISTLPSWRFEDPSSLTSPSSQSAKAAEAVGVTEEQVSPHVIFTNLDREHQP